MKKVSLAVALILTLSVACGKLGTVEHEGTINAKVQVDEAMLNGYFARYCCKVQLQATNGGHTPTDHEIASCAAEPSEDIEECSKNWTADFLAAMTSAIPSSSPVNGL